MDLSLCSLSLLFKFIDCLQEECKLGHGGRLGYIDAISELIDFRKVNGVSDGVLRKLSVTELYIKRARKTVAKMMRLQRTQDLDVESLAARVIKVNTRFGSSSTSSIATFEPAIECSISENTRPKIDSQPHSNRLLSQGRQRRPLRFTKHKRRFSKKGIDKHGFRRWTAILTDPDFRFQKGRLADSMKKRAELRFLPNENP